MKRLLAILLTLCMVLSLLPFSALAVETDADADQADPSEAQVAAADQEDPSAEAEDTSAVPMAAGSVKVRMSVQKDGAFLLDPMQDITVSSDMSQKYGYTDGSSSTPTLLDALIEAHVQYYGNAFTKDTAQDYLVVNNNGEPVKMFGEGSSAFPGDYAVNGVIPNIPYECGGTNYTHLHDTYLKEADSVEFFVFQDAANRKDLYTWISRDGKVGSTLTAEPGKAIALQVKGIHFLDDATKYANSDQIHESGSPINGVAIGVYDPATKAVTPKDWTTDENGSVSVSFDKAGTYYITPCGKDANSDPVIMSLAKVVVKPLVADPTPTSMTVELDTSDMIEITNKYTGTTYWYYMTAPDKDNVVSFKALDQNGNETLAEWESDSKALTINDPFTGKGDAQTTGNYSTRVKVTATSRLDSSVTASAEFYVLPFLTVSKNSISLTTDRDGKDPNYPQTFYVYPSEYVDLFRVNYEVADPNVVRVSGRDDSSTREVFPKRPGTTTVTVTDKLHPANTATVNVTVTGVSVEDAAGNFGKTTTYVDKTVQLKAFSSTENATFEWYSMDESIATVDANGLVTGKKPGVTIIHAEDQDENIGGITVMVGKDETSVYLDGLLLESASSYYEDEAYKKPLSSASYKYPGESYGTYGHYYSGYEVIDNTYYIKQSNSAFKAKLKTYFDAEKVRVEYYLDGEKIGEGSHLGEYEVTIPVGSSKLVVRAVSLTDAENYTDYTFNFEKARSTAGTVASTELFPSNRSADTARTFNGFAEGTCFQLDEDGNLIIPTSIYSKPWSATKYSYKAFLYGDVDQFRAAFTHTDAYTGRLAVSIDDGKTFSEGIGSVTSDLVSFDENGQAKLIVKSLDDASYAADKADGKDPWENENVKTYTIVVERLDKDVTGDVQITNVKFDDDCIPTTPYFSPMREKCGAMVPMDHNQTTVTLTVPEGVNVKAAWSSYSVTATLTDNGDGTWTIVCDTTLKSYGADRDLKLELSKETENGTVKNTYTITLYKMGKQASYSDPTGVRQYGVADSVVDYLPIGSQSVNDVWNSPYDQIGVMPERSLAGTGGWALQITTGSFGGYVTYYFANGISDDPAHPYGVDFTVYGNVRGRTGGPGTVLVSADGSTWYELAGSEHYDANAIWNYEVTYKRTETGTVSFTDNQGRSESFERASYDFQYPDAEYYPLHNWTDVEKESLTFTGTLLLGANGLDFSQQDAKSMTAAWGYTNLVSPGDMGFDASGNYIVKAINPYGQAGMTNGGNMFDLAWAVDSNGNPVKLDSIHYVKVQGGTMIQPTNSSNERSTLLSTVASMPAYEDVGVSSEPTAIKIGETELALEAGKYSYEVGVEKAFDVQVTAGEDANVFINNLRGTERSYNTTNEAFDFSKGILRIVVQDGEKAPVIYYITVHSLEKVEAVAATCEEDGCVEHWVCSECGKLYADAAGTTEISEEDLVVKATGHDWDEGKVTKEPTYTEEGEMTYTCKNDETHTKTEPIAKLEKCEGGDKCPSKDFVDVDRSENSWSHEPIDWAVVNEITNGMDPTHFGPTYTCTRAQAVTFLWRAMGEPEPTTTVNPFKDVSPDAYYYKAVLWAAEKEITNGVTADTFAPDATCTRGQIVTFLWRAEGKPASEAKIAFTDVPADAYFADAVAWAVENGITNGMSPTTFAPNNDCTRAHIVTFLYRDLA